MFLRLAVEKGETTGVTRFHDLIRHPLYRLAGVELERSFSTGRTGIGCHCLIFDSASLTKNATTAGGRNTSSDDVETN